MIFDTKVSEVLAFKGSSRVWALPAHANVRKAVEMMHENGIGSIVVIDEDQIIGVISERECLRRVALDGHLSELTPLREVVTHEAQTVTLQTTARECFEVMASFRVRYLPVVEHGALAGLVSIGDIVRALVDDQRFTIEQLLGYVTGSYWPQPDLLLACGR